jgi:4-carboxymuconolactone decarboxylase
MQVQFARSRLERIVLPRLPPIDPPCEQGVDAALGVIARGPRMFEMMRAIDALECGSLDRRHREIVILRTAARCNCDHVRRVRALFFAARVPLRETEMAAIAYGGASDPAWSQCERTLIRLVDELHETAHISDALWTELRRHWSNAQLVALVVVVGFYHASSLLVNGLGMEIDAWEVTRT